MQQQPRPLLAAVLIIVGVLCLLIAALGELFVAGHRPLGWAILALAVIMAATSTVLWRRGAFRRP